MALEDQWRLLIAQAAALITAMYALLFSRLRMQHDSRPHITYGPLRIMDEERQKNLDLIYNCNDTECVNMLRMRRAPFFKLCQLLRERNLLTDATFLADALEREDGLRVAPGNQLQWLTT